MTESENQSRARRIERNFVHLTSVEGLCTGAMAARSQWVVGAKFCFQAEIKGTKLISTQPKLNETCCFTSPDSSVSIATGYGLDGRGSIPRRGKIFLFSTVSTPTLRLTQPPIQGSPSLLSKGHRWLFLRE
jgi:hypothetical protein